MDSRCHKDTTESSDKTLRVFISTMRRAGVISSNPNLNFSFLSDFGWHASNLKPLPSNRSKQKHTRFSGVLCHNWCAPQVLFAVNAVRFSCYSVVTEWLNCSLFCVVFAILMCPPFAYTCFLFFLFFFAYTCSLLFADTCSRFTYTCFLGAYTCSLFFADTCSRFTYTCSLCVFFILLTPVHFLLTRAPFFCLHVFTFCLHVFTLCVFFLLTRAPSFSYTVNTYVTQPPLQLMLTVKPGKKLS